MLRRFEPALDYERFDAWWVSHGEKSIPKTALPSVGFINNGACCFLVQTDSTFALIEFLTYSRENRTNRLQIPEVVKACEDYARHSGFSHVIAPVDLKSVRQIALKRCGWFLKGPCELIAKELF